jgi:hypothetical protein
LVNLIIKKTVPLVITMAAASSTIKLIYFNAKGVIEPTRMMLAVAGVQYEDFRYPIDPTTWAKPEFDAAKVNVVF